MSMFHDLSINSYDKNETWQKTLYQGPQYQQ